MTATATQGSAEIELEFSVGTNLESARLQVSDALREVPDYPADVDEPVINTGEAGPGSPIAWLLLTAEDPEFDVQSLGDLANERIKPFLERSPGVSEVRVYGGRAAGGAYPVRPDPCCPARHHDRPIGRGASPRECQRLGR